MNSWVLGLLQGKLRFQLIDIASPMHSLGLGSTQRVSKVKRPGREADHSFPSNSQVKNDGATPHLRHTY
jgi:hypothetical protein